MHNAIVQLWGCADAFCRCSPDVYTIALTAVGGGKALLSEVCTSPRGDALRASDSSACAVTMLPDCPEGPPCAFGESVHQAAPASATTESDNADEQIRRGAGTESFPLGPSRVWLAWQPKYKFPGWRPLTCVCLCFQFYDVPDQCLPNLILNPQRGRLQSLWKLFISEFDFLMFSQCLIPVINTVLCFWPAPGSTALLPVHSNLSHVCRLSSHLLLSRQQIIAV